MTSSGKPIRSASATIGSTASARSTGAGSRVPGTTGTPAAVAERRAASLSPSAAIVALDGPTKTRPAVLDGRGEGRPLGEEAVARVDGLGTRRQRGLDDRVAAQVALGGRSRTEPDGAGRPAGRAPAEASASL